MKVGFIGGGRHFAKPAGEIARRAEKILQRIKKIPRTAGGILCPILKALRLAGRIPQI